MRLVRMVMALLVLRAVLAVSPVAAAPTTVLLGTATRGGGFEVYGAQLAAVINEMDASLKAETRATRGSAENLPLLEGGKLDVGLVEGNAARVAFDGVGRPPTRLRIVAAMYPGPGMFVVRGDSPYRTIGDLKGRPVAFGTPASGLTMLARDMLDGLGLSPGRDFQAVLLDSRRWAEARAGGQGGGAVGRRHRLAGVQGGGRRAAGRAFHRARCR